MSKTPGYIMIDATGAILSTGSTVTGLYAKLQKAIETGKPVYLYGVKYSSSAAEYTPIAATLTQASNVIYIDIALGSYNITSSDVLSANA